MHAKLLQLHLTFCNPMNCSPHGSSVHGILQARILELLCPPPGDLLDSGIEPMSLTSAVLAGRLFTASVTWGAQTFIYKMLSGHMFSLLWGIYLGVELLGHMVILFNFLRNLCVYAVLLKQFWNNYRLRGSCQQRIERSSILFIQFTLVVTSYATILH